MKDRIKEINSLKRRCKKVYKQAEVVSDWSIVERLVAVYEQWENKEFNCSGCEKLVKKEVKAAEAVLVFYQ